MKIKRGRKPSQNARNINLTIRFSRKELLMLTQMAKVRTHGNRAMLIRESLFGGTKFGAKK